MHPYPHTYAASAAGADAGFVTVGSPGLPDLETAAPPEFDGPGGVWSPESLLCASLADCFVLTFRSVSRAARFDWVHVECRVEGVLERVERVPQFVSYKTFARLTVRGGSNLEKARDLLTQAEHRCLISNSLRGSRALDVEVVVSDQ
ncbi:MAG TPA: OsmC family protein [Rudaea sp.]|nr:OsmC family protein [Rudaea sp.]